MRGGMDTNRTGNPGRTHGRTNCGLEHANLTPCWQSCLLWMVTLLLWASPALAQASYDFEATASDLADQLAQHFPPLEAHVVEVRGKQFYLSLRAQDQVLEGMRLNVFREGEELISPASGEVLGRLEEGLGTVTVTQVAETYAVAVPADVAGGVTVQAGDKVRITAGRLPLGLLPVTGQTDRAVPLGALADAVQRSLRATGRFYVVPRARLTLWRLERNLSAEDLLDPEFMSEAASALGVTYVVQPVLRDTGGTVTVELRLIAPAQPQVPVSTALAILSEVTSMSQQSGLQRPSAVSAPPLPPDSASTVVRRPPTPAANIATLQSLLGADPITLEKSYVPLAQFPTELRGFDAADFDDDGQTELVIISGTEVLLCHVQESKLVRIASYADGRPGILLSAQLVRLGAERTPGVVVNRYSQSRKGMDSFFLVVQGNQLVPLQRGLSDILLGVDSDGDGVNESLWGQRFDGERFFRHGQIRQYELRNGRLKRQRLKAALPASFRATGTTLAQLDARGSRQLVFVDGRHNLHVYEGKTRRWTSPKNVGGSYVHATLEVIGLAGIPQRIQFDFEAIPAVADFDGDGIDEVLVPQNHVRLGAVPNLNLYGGGQVVMMRQTPQGFSLSPISPEFDGVVSGVAVLKGHTPGIVVAVSKRDGLLRQKKQTILYLNRL